jgi:hypothetical protein
LYFGRHLAGGSRGRGTSPKASLLFAAAGRMGSRESLACFFHDE